MAAAGGASTDRHLGAWQMMHGRYYLLLLAKRHVTRRLFGEIRKIAALPAPAGYRARRAQRISVTRWGEKGMGVLRTRRKERPIPKFLGSGEAEQNRGEAPWTQRGLTPCVCETLS